MSSSGASDPTEVDSGDYVGDGGSIDWSALGATIGGSLILSWTFGLIELIDTVRAGVLVGASRIGDWLTVGVFEVLETPAELISLSWRTTAIWLSSLGVAAYPVAIIITVSVLWAGATAVRWAGETVFGVT